ncbi:MAG: sn-glycerol-3-phosphate import ATP-binding protein UgpC [Psychromonas sp.]
MSTLTLLNIEKRYPNGFQAIKTIDLSIDDGEFVVLVGPSGCGKSTLLRMIAGLESITSGELQIDDTLVNEMEPSERDIAMVFQNYALYPHMTVYNNMAYGLRNRKTSKQKIDQLVKQVAEMLELTPLLSRKPKQLSGGQRQRVAMGRAIVRNPKVFLFDEPLSNLDAKLRVQMRLEIKRLQRSMNTTAIYVTHDQVEAMTLADKLVVLNKGHVEQVGTPLQIYDRPQSTFVATFMGSPAMNIVDALLTEQGVCIEDDTGKQSEKVVQGRGLTVRPVKLGLRPEHLYFTDINPWFTVEVELVEALGAELLLYCKMQEKAAEKLVIRVDAHQKVSIGDVRGVDINQQHCHYFDDTTEQRITPFMGSTLGEKCA